MSLYGWVAIVIAGIIQLADVWTTWTVLDHGGREVGFAALFVKWGWPRWLWMLAAKSVFASFTAWAYFRSGETAMLAVLAVMSALGIWAVINNWNNIRWGAD